MKKKVLDQANVMGKSQNRKSIAGGRHFFCRGGFAHWNPPKWSFSLTARHTQLRLHLAFDVAFCMGVTVSELSFRSSGAVSVSHALKQTDSKLGIFRIPTFRGDYFQQTGSSSEPPPSEIKNR